MWSNLKYKSKTARKVNSAIFTVTSKQKNSRANKQTELTFQTWHPVSAAETTDTWHQQ